MYICIYIFFCTAIKIIVVLWIIFILLIFIFFARIHDLEFVEELCKIEAHDSEVLCLEYSKPIIVAG